MYNKILIFRLSSSLFSKMVIVSASQQFQYFAGGMSVGNIPGITFACQQRLHILGIFNANQLFLQYHLLQQNYAAFTGWLVNTCGATTPHANLCFNAIRAQYG